jgi:hypothetical protein
MATQTQTKRQAAGKKAAATRKRNAARRSATATKRSAAATRGSARRTGRAAASTSRSAQRTTRQATQTAGNGFDAIAARLDAFARQAERALLIQIGAAAAVGDALAQTAETYTSVDRVARELDKFERRGARVLRGGQQAARRRRRDVQSEMQTARREVEGQANGLRADAQDVLERVRNII